MKSYRGDDGNQSTVAVKPRLFAHTQFNKSGKIKFV